MCGTDAYTPSTPDFSSLTSETGSLSFTSSCSFLVLEKKTHNYCNKSALKKSRLHYTVIGSNLKKKCFTEHNSILY
jgi:hypothetical protein